MIFVCVRIRESVCVCIAYKCFVSVKFIRDPKSIIEVTTFALEKQIIMTIISERVICFILGINLEKLEENKNPSSCASLCLKSTNVYIYIYTASLINFHNILVFVELFFHLCNFLSKYLGV